MYGNAVPSFLLAALLLLAGGAAQAAEALAARQIIERAIDQNRGLTSYARLTMRIVRPAWQRSMTLETWTRGREDALIRFVAPPRDAGNATLKLGEKMWTFTPKLNRTIRLPFSLMSQSWVGSDFSYDDLSRTDNLLQHYTLTLLRSEPVDGQLVHVIEAIPLGDAPVVWGKEEWRIRDDNVLVEQSFFDQDLQPVKRMTVLEVKEMGGRKLGSRLRMFKVDTPEQYTELHWDEAAFDIELTDEFFSLFNLQHEVSGMTGRNTGRNNE